MELFDELYDLVEEVVDDVLPDFDPTNPNAAFNDITQAAGEAAVTAVTGGAGAGVFTSVTEGIGDFHEATDNAFTVNNLEETVESISSEILNLDLDNVELDPEDFIDEVWPDFDPTNPNSEYGDNIQSVAEAVLTSIYGKSAGSLFTTVTDSIGELNEANDNAFTLNNLRDAVSEIDLSQLDPTNPNSALNQGLAEIDPTNPDAEYDHYIRTGGDGVLNYVTEGQAGTAFSDASQGIQDLHELTNNTFTLNNLRDTLSESLSELDSIEAPAAGCVFLSEEELQGIEEELRGTQDSELGSIGITTPVEDGMEYSPEFDYYNLREAPSGDVGSFGGGCFGS